MQWNHSVAWRCYPTRWGRACGRGGIALILAFILALPGAATAQTAMWRDTGIAVLPDPDLTRSPDLQAFAPAASLSFCLDATRPATLFVNDRASTRRVDWTTGAQLATYPARFSTCTPATGTLFTVTDAGVVARFGPGEPQGRAITYFPNRIFRDGAVLLHLVPAARYSLNGQAQFTPGHLWVSTDNGDTWQERTPYPGGYLGDVHPAGADGRVLYAVASVSADANAALYVSGDAGATWELRAPASDMLRVADVAGATLPASTVLLIEPPAVGSHETGYSLSLDSGRTRKAIGESGVGYDVQFAATGAGIIRVAVSNRYPAYSLTTDGGTTWQPLALPYDPLLGNSAGVSAGAPLVSLAVSPLAPSLVFLHSIWALDHGAHPVQVSQDGGVTWQPLAAGRVQLAITGAPLTLLSGDGGTLEALDVGALASVAPPGAALPGTAIAIATP